MMHSVRPARTRLAVARGFSLLEVILALAILVGALAVLGEMVRLGVFNAASARDLTQAQLLCESKLAELTSGITPVAVVQQVPYDLDPEWLYSITLEPVDQPGLVAVRVTVEQSVAVASRPVACSLVRWMADPGVELPESPEPEPAESSSSSSTGSSSSGS